MLLEIYSEAFKDGDNVRPPIVFHHGLNTVMGASRAENSIGKTTFLLAIDYAFGGKDYTNLNPDIDNEVGQHVIYFTFEFKGKKYYFARDTENNEIVYECDSNRKYIKEITLTEYCDFLAIQYGMDKLDASFRDLVSGYFRIYGRENYTETQPLKAFGNDTKENGIRRLLQLYNVYGQIGELTKLADEAESKETTYKNAFKYNYVRGVTRKQDYEANEKTIAELEIKKEDLAKASSLDLLEMDSFQAARLSELKGRLKALRRQRSVLNSRLKAMSDDMEFDTATAAQDYSDLVEFFPAADVKHIAEIEAFHKKIKSVLKTEYRTSSDKLNDGIALLEEELEEINDTPTLTQAILDDYAKIDREIKNLKEANEYYFRKQELNTAAKDLQSRKEVLIQEEISKLQGQINSKLAELNSVVCGSDIYAPVLTIKDSKDYKYHIPKDTGTGSQTRGMYLFDLVSLINTPLPAVAQDSVTVKQVEDKVILNIFQLYRECPKQIFIAIDKGESYSATNDGIPPVLAETTVIELSAGHELYGKPWNKKQTSK